jgi:DNA-binding CsgD family transcriptional regulator
LAVEHGLASAFRTQVLRLNGAEAAIELGRVAEAIATVDSMYEQPTRPGAASIRSAITQMRARVDLLRDHEPTPREGNGDGFDSDREQAVLDAEHHHWSRQPVHAYEAALSGLHHLMVVEAGLEHCLCGGLLTLAMRACADLGESARRERDLAGVDDAVGKRIALEKLRQRFVDEFGEDPLHPRDTIAPIRGDLAGWEAERKRVTQDDTVDDWAHVAQIWSGMKYVHRAAYAWLRAAECAAREPLDRSAVAEALRHAYELSDGHMPLRRAVEDLARRCRVAGVGRAARLRGTGAGSLTDQENRVLRLVALGLTDGDIASQLVLSVRTVNVHVSNILRKLDVPNRGAAARWAHAHGLMAD